MYASYLSQGKSIEFEVKANRQAYLVLFEGRATVNGIQMNMRDALEIAKEPVSITAEEEAHLLMIEMAFDESLL